MLQAINTKILISGITILAAAALVIGGTFAWFSDSETSRGNLLQAGAIDLGIDNHIYYNGRLNEGTTWRIDYDIDEEQGTRQFFNFRDVKPGDWGEDTISLHVKDNESWLCADVTLTSDDDNDCTEPENDVEGANCPTDGSEPDLDNADGDLADAVRFYWWADDGDNVFECVMEEEETPDGIITRCNPQAVGSEHLLPAGPMGNLDVGETATVALADSDQNIWGDTGPLPGGDVRFVAKAWCFGDTDMTPYPQDGGNQQQGPDDRPVLCDGESEDNMTQTDSFTADIAFRAIQSRHNENFQCVPPSPTPSPILE